MTSTQTKTVNELKANFGGDHIMSFEVVDLGKTSRVYMSATFNCKDAYYNEFEIGPRGGLKTVRKEFTAYGPCRG